MSNDLVEFTSLGELKQKRYPFLFHDLSQTKLDVKAGFGKDSSPTNLGLMYRIGKALLSELNANTNSNSDMWSVISEGHAEIVALFKRNQFSQAQDYLRRMFAMPLTHGFHQGHIIHNTLKSNEEARAIFIVRYLDKLAALAEALACVPVENPEQGSWGKLIHSDPDELLSFIERALSINIQAPKWRGGLFGLITNRGSFTDRDLVGLYVAQRIAHLCPDKNTPICEIGAGVGYVAYYASLLGYKNFTIVDLPTVNIAQAYFLASNLPETRIIFSDEHENPFSVTNAIKVLSPRFFAQAPNKYFGLVINIDSLPEIDSSVVSDYLHQMLRNAHLFLSINQETMRPTRHGGKQGRVRDFVNQLTGFTTLNRSPFWLRKGYVEEVFNISQEVDAEL